MPNGAGQSGAEVFARADRGEMRRSYARFDSLVERHLQSVLLLVADGQRNQGHDRVRFLSPECRDIAASILTCTFPLIVLDVEAPVAVK